MPPDPPRVERALLAPQKSFALSQHSPVTLTYSPATVILNENPGHKEDLNAWALNVKYEGAATNV